MGRDAIQSHDDKLAADLPAALVGAGYLPLLQRHLKRLRKARRHPNRLLHYDDLFAAYLLAFFNPTLRSLRTIEDFSTTPRMQEHLSIDRLCRSTLSDANAVMDAGLLLPLIADLRRRLPALGRADAKLERILRHVQVVDGSLFRVAGEVAWALRRRSPGSATRHDHFVRLDLQLCGARGVPVEVAVSGKADSEVAVALRKVQSGVTYVADRGIFSFAYLQRILEAGSDFVLRIRANQKFTPARERTLTQQDKDAGVISDRTGTLTGDRYRPAPQTTLREVVVLDPLTGRPVRLLTTLPDAPAHVVGAVYRHRWQIELFFRWLKVHARFRHLISHNANGLHLGFYVAVIAVLLIYLHSGKKPSLYAYNMLCAVAGGWADVADILPVLERRERQRDRARQTARRAAKIVK